MLENEIKQLKYEILTYESYLQKTAVWCENMGKWTTNVVNARLTLPSDSVALGVEISEPTVFFEIQVQLHDPMKVLNEIESYEVNRVVDPSEYQPTEGWIIYRTLKQFENLNEILSDIDPGIRNEFRKISSSNLKSALSSKSTDDSKVKSAISQLDHYLKIVAKDPTFSQSQAFYSFLCPSPDYLKEKMREATSSGTADDKFTISSLFRGNISRDLSLDDDLDRLFGEAELNLVNTNKDSIAEPFYYLIEELFEIKGMKKWFRKSLILFVQLTYGATINRKIRESINWILSDEMLSYYIKLTRESFWQLDAETNKFTLIPTEETVRLIEEKLKTKNMAKVKLLLNMPDALQKLVGEKNAQIGVIKLFETFQDEKLNKHLVYVS